MKKVIYISIPVLIAFALFATDFKGVLHQYRAQARITMDSSVKVQDEQGTWTLTAAQIGAMSLFTVNQLTNYAKSNFVGTASTATLATLATTAVTATNLAIALPVDKAPGITTNINVMLGDSTTNALWFTNGILMRVSTP